MKRTNLRIGDKVVNGNNFEGIIDSIMDNKLCICGEWVSIEGWKRVPKKIEKPMFRKIDSYHKKFDSVYSSVVASFKKDLFTISRKGEIYAVYTSCGGDTLQNFKDKVILALREFNLSLVDGKRITKREIIDLPTGSEYKMVYVSNINGSVEVEYCKKKRIDTALVWTVSGKLEHIQSMSIINDDGSFTPSHSTIPDEIGYLYI
jgi:hypothetical protein